MSQVRESIYSEMIDIMKKKIILEIIYSVEDKNKYDPQIKSVKMKEEKCKEYLRSHPCELYATGQVHDKGGTF